MILSVLISCRFSRFNFLGFKIRELVFSYPFTVNFNTPHYCYEYWNYCNWYLSLNRRISWVGIVRKFHRACRRSTALDSASQIIFFASHVTGLTPRPGGTVYSSSSVPLCSWLTALSCRPVSLSWNSVACCEPCWRFDTIEKRVLGRVRLPPTPARTWKHQGWDTMGHLWCCGAEGPQTLPVPIVFKLLHKCGKECAWDKGTSEGDAFPNTSTSVGM